MESESKPDVKERLEGPDVDQDLKAEETIDKSTNGNDQEKSIDSPAETDQCTHEYELLSMTDQSNVNDSSWVSQKMTAPSVIGVVEDIPHSSPESAERSGEPIAAAETGEPAAVMLSPVETNQPSDAPEKTGLPLFEPFMVTPLQSTSPCMETEPKTCIKGKPKADLDSKERRKEETEKEKKVETKAEESCEPMAIESDSKLSAHLCSKNDTSDETLDSPVTGKELNIGLAACRPADVNVSDQSCFQTGWGSAEKSFASPEQETEKITGRSSHSQDNSLGTPGSGPETREGTTVAPEKAEEDSAGSSSRAQSKPTHNLESSSKKDPAIGTSSNTPAVKQPEAHDQFNHSYFPKQYMQQRMAKYSQTQSQPTRYSVAGGNFSSSPLNNYRAGFFPSWNSASAYGSGVRCNYQNNFYPPPGYQWNAPNCYPRYAGGMPVPSVAGNFSFWNRQRNISLADTYRPPDYQHNSSLGTGFTLKDLVAGTLEDAGATCIKTHPSTAGIDVSLNLPDSVSPVGKPLAPGTMLLDEPLPTGIKCDPGDFSPADDPQPSSTKCSASVKTPPTTAVDEITAAGELLPPSIETNSPSDVGDMSWDPSAGIDISAADKELIPGPKGNLPLNAGGRCVEIIPTQCNTSENPPSNISLACKSTVVAASTTDQIDGCPQVGSRSVSTLISSRIGSKPSTPPLLTSESPQQSPASPCLTDEVLWNLPSDISTAGEPLPPGTDCDLLQTARDASLELLDASTKVARTKPVKTTVSATGNELSLNLLSCVCTVDELLPLGPKSESQYDTHLKARDVSQVLHDTSPEACQASSVKTTPSTNANGFSFNLPSSIYIADKPLPQGSKSDSSLISATGMFGDPLAGPSKAANAAIKFQIKNQPAKPIPPLRSILKKPKASTGGACKSHPKSVPSMLCQSDVNTHVGRQASTLGLPSVRYKPPRSHLTIPPVCNTVKKPKDSTGLASKSCSVVAPSIHSQVDSNPLVGHQASNKVVSSSRIKNQPPLPRESPPPLPPLPRTPPPSSPVEMDWMELESPENETTGIGYSRSGNVNPVGVGHPLLPQKLQFSSQDSPSPNGSDIVNKDPVSQSRSYENERERRHIPVFIEPTDYPNSRLSDKEMTNIENDILDAILEMDENGIPIFPQYYPIFTQSIRRNGRFGLICSDESTRKWLYSYFETHKPWPNSFLRIVSKDFTEIQANAVLPLSCDDDNEKILKFIGKQNKGLNVSKWEVVKRWESCSKTFMDLVIDSESAEVLNCNEIIFKLGTGKIVTALKKTLDSYESHESDCTSESDSLDEEVYANLYDESTFELEKKTEFDLLEHEIYAELYGNTASLENSSKDLGLSRGDEEKLEPKSKVEHFSVGDSRCSGLRNGPGRSSSICSQDGQKPCELERISRKYRSPSPDKPAKKLCLRQDQDSYRYKMANSQDHRSRKTRRHRVSRSLPKPNILGIIPPKSIRCSFPGERSSSSGSESDSQDRSSRSQSRSSSDSSSPHRYSQKDGIRASRSPPRRICSQVYSPIPASRPHHSSSPSGCNKRESSGEDAACPKICNSFVSRSPSAHSRSQDSPDRQRLSSTFKCPLSFQTPDDREVPANWTEKPGDDNVEGRPTGNDLFGIQSLSTQEQESINVISPACSPGHLTPDVVTDDCAIIEGNQSDEGLQDANQKSQCKLLSSQCSSGQLLQDAATIGDMGSSPEVDEKSCKQPSCSLLSPAKLLQEAAFDDGRFEASSKLDSDLQDVQQGSSNLPIFSQYQLGVLDSILQQLAPYNHRAEDRTPLDAQILKEVAMGAHRSKNSNPLDPQLSEDVAVDAHRSKNSTPLDPQLSEEVGVDTHRSKDSNPVDSGSQDSDQESNNSSTSFEYDPDRPVQDVATERFRKLIAAGYSCQEALKVTQEFVSRKLDAASATQSKPPKKPKPPSPQPPPEPTLKEIAADKFHKLIAAGFSREEAFEFTKASIKRQMDQLPPSATPSKNADLCALTLEDL